MLPYSYHYSSVPPHQRTPHTTPAPASSTSSRRNTPSFFDTISQYLVVLFRRASFAWL